MIRPKDKITGSVPDCAPIEALREAIVIQAMRDYRKALYRLDKHPGDWGAQVIIEDCESFFLSDWFAQLCPVGGAEIMKFVKGVAYAIHG